MGTQEEDRLKPRQLLLFNDMLMLVKEKSDDKLSYKAHIDFIDQVSIDWLQRSYWRRPDWISTHAFVAIVLH